MAAAVARQPALSGNQGNAQAAANWPAISATMWLLADDPRLGKPGQPLLVVVELPQEGRVALEQRPGPGQPSSSRRIHTQDSSRMPSSMPLVQWTPDRNGLAAHQERSWAAAASA